MTRGRKRKVILEKIQKSPNDFLHSMNNLFLNPPPYYEPFRKNHFAIQLENEHEGIEPYKICGYKIEEFSDKSIITISSILIVGDWVEQFKKMTMVKIFFLDSIGNFCELFDYDIMYEGFSLEGSHKSDEVLTSTFKYIILE